MIKINSLYVVDDDETYQFIVHKTIQETQMVKDIRIFSTGKEAIDFLQKALENQRYLPDIILLDLTMPVMDGWEFLEHYLLLKPNVGKTIHIFIVSSSINPADVIRAKNISEVTDYIVKPVTKEKFIELLLQL